MRTSPDRLPDSVLRRHVRAFSRPRDEPLIKQAYDVARAETTGQLKRSDYWWDVRVFKRSPSGAVYVDPGSKAIAGYLLFDVPEGGAYGAQQLLVRELHAPTPGAYRGLIGFLGALGDQYEVVELALPRGQGAPLLDEPGIRDEPIVYETAARHPGLCPPAHTAQRRSVLGLTAAGAMGRIIDVAAALALHPSPRKHGVRGAIGVDVEDPVFTDAPRAFDVTFAARGVQTAPGSTAGDRLSLSIERLTQILFRRLLGARFPSQGFVVGSAKAAALLDAAFAGPPALPRRLQRASERAALGRQAPAPEPEEELERARDSAVSSPPFRVSTAASSWVSTRSCHGLGSSEKGRRKLRSHGGRVEQQDEVVVDKPIARLVHVVQPLPRQEHAEALRERVRPVLVGHQLPVRAIPLDIVGLAAADRAPLEEVERLSAGCSCRMRRHLRVNSSSARDGSSQRPRLPRERAVLAVRVVVPPLRAPPLVAVEQHRRALREQERRHDVPRLPRPQLQDLGVVGRPLDAAVPRAVVVGAVAVPLPVRLVVLVVVRDEVRQGEAVVGRDEVDARVRPAPAVLVEVAAPREPEPELAEAMPPRAAPEVAQRVPITAVPLRPAHREIAHLVAALRPRPRARR